MLKKLMVTLVIFGASNLAFADDVARATAQKTIPMEDGSTLYIFKDGKMSMEDKFGRAVRMKKA